MRRYSADWWAGVNDAANARADASWSQRPKRVKFIQWRGAERAARDVVLMAYSCRRYAEALHREGRI